MAGRPYARNVSDRSIRCSAIDILQQIVTDSHRGKPPASTQLSGIKRATVPSFGTKLKTQALCTKIGRDESLWPWGVELFESYHVEVDLKRKILDELRHLESVVSHKITEIESDLEKLTRNGR